MWIRWLLAISVGILSLLSPGSLIASEPPPGGHAPGGHAPGGHAPGGPATGGPATDEQRPQGQNGAQDPPDKIIEACRVALATVGPNGRRDRENAVTRLFSMDEPRAHEVLQVYVLPGPDPVAVRRMILGELPRRLANRNEKPFWHSKHDDHIPRSYVMKLVRHFETGAKATPLSGELRDLARDAIVEMARNDLVKGFEELLKNGDTTLRILAMRAMGASRNPAWALMLAPWLHGGSMSGAAGTPEAGTPGAGTPGAGNESRVAGEARAAIYNLTYQKFSDQAAFAAWWAKKNNQSADYTELAERAARGGMAALDLRAAKFERENIDVIVQMVELLATSSTRDRWKRIRGWVFKGEPEGLLLATLERLRSVLADAAINPKGSDAKDRLEFFLEIAKRLAARPAAPEHALLLEVASYLCGPGEAAPRAAQEKRLRDGIANPTSVVRVAALRGLRRFFSVANRAIVVRAARRAFDGGQQDELAVALGTMLSPDWRSPKPTDEAAQDWLTSLRAMLVSSDLPTELRAEVVKVLCQPDADGGHQRQVFQLLCQDVAREGLAVEVRRQALLRLVRLLPAADPGRVAAAKLYLSLLNQLQKSKDVQIRLSAARRLVVPSGLAPDDAKALGQAMVESVGARLLHETDNGVFAAQVTALRNLASQEAHAGAVNSRLRSALEKLRSEPAVSKRLNELVDGLEQLALDERSTAAEWIETCRRLLAPPLSERDRVLCILQYHVGRENGQKLAKAPKEDQQAVAKLVLRTAVLRPVGTPWQGDPALAEAKMVQRAFKELWASGEFSKDKTLDTPAMRLMAMRCLALVGDKVFLEQRAKAWLADSDQLLKGVDRDAARLLYADVLLQQDKLAAAWQTTGIQTVAGSMLVARLRVTEAIADAMVRRQKPKDAVVLLADLVKRTAKAAPAYWGRFEKHLRVRFRLDPSQGQALLKELDGWTRGSGKPTPDQRAAAERLRVELRGAAQPPK